jgi:hypothetical protein
VSTRRLVRLDKLRLEKEPPAAPDAMLGAATDFMRKMGLTLAPGGDELRDFCNRHGLASEYRSANRMLYASIVIGVACVYGMVKFGGTAK